MGWEVGTLLQIRVVEGFLDSAPTTIPSPPVKIRTVSLVRRSEISFLSLIVVFFLPTVPIGTTRLSLVKRSGPPTLIGNQLKNITPVLL